ncbi:HD domain-containing phosphohydrolase [Emcibacter sp. SYSU 3D8]|uniref:HD-GYP domain-containing protein n=1 Tax=Emcibacter sp. SYSU 3D8 TaxID=3133969 RepID=UPI0031FF3EFC
MNKVATSVHNCLIALEEMRSATLRNHDAGVAAICAALCRGMGIQSGLAVKLSFAAGMHDIGKVVIPDAIINKPAPLNTTEQKVMRRHPMMGFNILRNFGDDALKLAANAALYHHECWDGSGYPTRLSGTAIPLEARIVAICDVYHALREPRSYRAALSHDDVMGMILGGDGSDRLHPGKFDPAVLDSFRASAHGIQDAFESTL